MLARVSHQHSSRFGQTVFPDVEESSEGRVKLTLPRMAMKTDGDTDAQSGRMVGEKSGLARCWSGMPPDIASVATDDEAKKFKKIQYNRISAIALFTLGLGWGAGYLFSAQDGSKALASAAPMVAIMLGGAALIIYAESRKYNLQRELMGRL